MPSFSITNKRRLGTELRVDTERMRTFDATGTACTLGAAIGLGSSSA